MKNPNAHYNINGHDAFEIFADMPFYDGNVLKYLIRCVQSGKFYKDLEKALVYIKRVMIRGDNYYLDELEIFLAMANLKSKEDQKKAPLHHQAIIQFLSGHVEDCHETITTMLTRLEEKNKG